MIIGLILIIIGFGLMFVAMLLNYNIGEKVMKIGIFLLGIGALLSFIFTVFLSTPFYHNHPIKHYRCSHYSCY